MLLATGLALAGCARSVLDPRPGGSGSSTTPTIPPAGGSPSQSTPTPTAEPTPTPPPPSLGDQVRSRVAAMTLEQKAGQLIIVEWRRDARTAAEATELITQLNAGGVLLLGVGWTMGDTRAATAGVSALTATPGIRMFIAMDQEGGTVQRLSGAGVTPIPPATEQGSWPVEQLNASAAGWANELIQAGVNVNLAPVADTVPADMVATNEPIGSLNRQFGSDPVQVGEHAAAFVNGMSSRGVLTALKHFPGLGRVTANTDFAASGIEDGITTVDDPYLEAFRLGMAADPAMVMISSAVYPRIDPSRQAMFSPAIITGLLRGRMGWDGLVIGDSMDAAAVAAIPAGQRAVDFVSAGGDLMTLRSAEDLQSAHQALVAQIAASPDFAAQVDAAVTRILLAKASAGLLDL